MRPVATGDMRLVATGDMSDTCAGTCAGTYNVPAHGAGTMSRQSAQGHCPSPKENKLCFFYFLGCPMAAVFLV